jgi:hypothetical protein
MPSLYRKSFGDLCLFEVTNGKETFRSSIDGSGDFAILYMTSGARLKLGRADHVRSFYDKQMASLRETNHPWADELEMIVIPVARMTDDIVAEVNAYCENAERLDVLKEKLSLAFAAETALKP